MGITYMEMGIYRHQWSMTTRLIIDVSLPVCCIIKLGHYKLFTLDIYIHTYIHTYKHVKHFTLRIDSSVKYGIQIGNDVTIYKISR